MPRTVAMYMSGTQHQTTYNVVLMFGRTEAINIQCAPGYQYTVCSRLSIYSVLQAINIQCAPG